MKKLIFILITSFFCSCTISEREHKQYKFLVYYINQGTPNVVTDTISWLGYGENRFFLKGGDIVRYCGGEDVNETIISGVCRFEVISITVLDDPKKCKK